jgi:hypothetical protein
VEVTARTTTQKRAFLLIIFSSVIFASGWLGEVYAAGSARLLYAKKSIISSGKFRSHGKKAVNIR